VASPLPAGAAWLSQRQREGVSLSFHHASGLEDLLASMRQRENIWLPWHERGPLGSRRSSEGIGGFVIASGGRLALAHEPAREYLASLARARAAWLS
jgi:hypothetical protein